jgi:GxxExxY protein
MRLITSIPQIYADQIGLKHHELTEKLIGIFYGIYNELGHGFLESIYEQVFSVALVERGIFSARDGGARVVSRPKDRRFSCRFSGR